MAFTPKTDFNFKIGSVEMRALVDQLRPMLKQYTDKLQKLSDTGDSQIVLVSPGGTAYKVTVTDAGALTTTAL